MNKFARLFFCLALLSLPCEARAERRPNLLIIQTDEHNFRTLGCYRRLLSKEQALMWGPQAIVETPNIVAGKAQHLDHVAIDGLEGVFEVLLAGGDGVGLNGRAVEVASKAGQRLIALVPHRFDDRTNLVQEGLKVAFGTA